MRKAFFIWFAVAMIACAPFKRIAVTKLSEKEQLEYDFSFIEAQKQALFGNYKDAISLYLRCITLNPASAAANYQVANILLTQSQKGKALLYAKRAVKLDETNEWYLLQLAQIYQLNENVDSIIYIYQKLLKLSPSKYDYSQTLAVLYLHKGELNKSLKILDKLEHDNGPVSEIYINKYRIYIAKGDNRNSIKVLQDAVRKFPNESKFYGLLGEHYTSINQNDSALKYFNLSIAINPNDERGYLSLIDYYRNIKQPLTALKISKDFIANHDFSMSSKIEIVSSYLNDRKNFAKYKLDIKSMIDSISIQDSKENLGINVLRADYFLLTDKLKSALSEVEYILTKDKKRAVIWEQLLFVLNSMNDYQRMIISADEAIFYFNRNPLLYLYKGIALYKLKRFDDAIHSLTSGLIYASGSKELLAKFYNFLGESYNAIKDYPNSDIFFERALNIDSKNIFVLNNYSYYLALRNDKLDKALAYSKQCIDQLPKSCSFLDTYGWVLFKAGKINEAKKILEDALENGGLSNVEILEHYGEILISMSKKEEALKYYRLIKGLGKESNRLKELLNLDN